MGDPKQEKGKENLKDGVECSMMITGPVLEYQAKRPWKRGF